MIVSASYRTDIPAFYGQWFLNRLKAGYALARNPYGGKDYRIELSAPELTGFVFWTKFLSPFFSALEEVAARQIPFTLQMSLTGYPRVLESSAPDLATGIKNFTIATNRYPGSAVWRYDPVVFSGATPAPWHIQQFENIAKNLEGTTDEVVISFAQIYAKTQRGLDRSGLSWRDPPQEEKQELLMRLAAIAHRHGMKTKLCSQPELLIPEVEGARCVDAARLSRMSGLTIPADPHGNRKGCLCHRSKDLGDYDSCTLGCVYCYAVRNRDTALKRLKQHDPAGEYLIPPAKQF